MTGKRRRRKGLVAMGMSLVLAMSVAPPVWAETQTVGEDNDQNDSGKKSYTDYDSTEIQGTLVTVDNEISYTVSVPKKISFVELVDTSNKTISNAVFVKSCKIAPKQIIQIGVKGVKLKSASNGSSAERDLYAFFGDENTNLNTYDYTDLMKDHNDSVEVQGNSAVSIKGDANSNFIVPDLKLRAPVAIKAGVWYGTLNYKVKIVAVGDNPANHNDVTWQ